jgi:hypothetical protein
VAARHDRDRRCRHNAATPLDFAIAALLTLFVVVDPVGATPTFLAVTEDLPRAARPARGARGVRC